MEHGEFIGKEAFKANAEPQYKGADKCIVNTKEFMVQLGADIEVKAVNKLSWPKEYNGLSFKYKIL